MPHFPETKPISYSYNGSLYH